MSIRYVYVIRRLNENDINCSFVNGKPIYSLVEYCQSEQGGICEKLNNPQRKKV